MGKSSYKGITVDISFQGNTTKFNEAVSQVDKRLKNIDSELNNVNRSLKLDPTNATLVGQKFELLGKKISETKDKLELMKSAQKEIESAYARGEIDKGAYRDFQRELGKTEAQLKSLNTEVKRTTDTITAELKSAVSSLKTEFDGVADVIKKSELALVAFTAASAKVGAGFESGMSQVAATLQVDSGSEEYKKLSAAAKEMGETTSYSAAQAASALNSLAQAGYTADEAIERLPKTLALAKAGGLDLANAAKIVTNSMASLNLSEEELDKLLDEMARTGQKSNTNIAELGEAVKAVGGTMEMAGQSIETMFTELGMLANAGVAASEAGNHLRNIMLALVKTDVRSSLHEMGVEVLDSTGKIRDLCDIMTDLRAATNGMLNGELVAMFGDLFNVRDLASINALLNGTNGAMQALRAEIENSQGAATQMATTMGDNLTGDVTILKSAVEGLQIAISERLNPSLRKAAQDGTDFISSLTNSVKSGELRKVFDDFGKTLSDMLEKGLVQAEKILPVIIKYLGKIIEHADDLLVLYTAITVQTKSKAVLKSIVELTGGVKTLVTALRSAEAAQLALNAAQSASLIGAIAAVIGLAVAALVKYKLSMDDASESERKFSQSAKDAIASADDLTAALERNAVARKAAVEDVEKQYGAYEKLAKATFALAEQENLSAGQKKLLADHVSELNAAIPDLNLAIDEETGKLSKQYDEVEKLIGKTKEYYLLKASEANLTQVGSDLFNAEYEQAKIKEQLEENLRKRQNAVNRMQFGQNSPIGTFNIVYTQAQEEYNILLDEEEKLRAKSDELAQSTAELEEEYKRLTDYTEELAKTVGDYSTETDGATESTEDLLKGTKVVAKSAEELKAAYTNAKSAVSTYKSELKDLISVLDSVKKGTAYSTSQILDLIEKYPELTAAIHETADGYTVEADALKNLMKVKAESMVLEAQKALASLESQIPATVANNPIDYRPHTLADGSYGVDQNLIRQQTAARAAAIDELETERKRLQNQLSIYEKLSDSISQGKIYSGNSSSGSSSSSSSSSSSGLSDYAKQRKEAAQAEMSELERQYKMEEISTEEYYDRLLSIAERYYKNVAELRDEYNNLRAKAYEGLKKAQEDELSTAKKLEDQYRALKKAKDDLTNAENQKKWVYSAAAGYHAESDTAAIEKAQQNLADKNYTLAETLLKNAKFSGQSLSERLQSIGLSQIKDMLPDLTGLTLPSLGGGSTTNNTTTTRNITYNGGDINVYIQGSTDTKTVSEVTENVREAVRAELNALLDDADNTRKTGGF